MAVSASFHRNVLLLTHVIQPNDDFKKHFREGMFDKPNTAGFIHVSHYLLNVYDSERFKKSIQWPVTCKKTEAKYRNDVKDFLTAMASENPDIGFPPILTSHLFHAGGNKFTIIMWKLSQVVVRTYIKRDTTHTCMFAPKAGNMGNLAKKFLEASIASIKSDTWVHRRKLSSMEETAKTALEEEDEKLTKIKAEIFEKEELIAKHASNAPVHPSIKKRLMNTNDEEVIQMWKTSINEGLNYTRKQQEILRDIESLSCKASDIAVNSTSDAKVLDGKQLEKINYSLISELFPPEVQCLLYNLYKNDKLVLQNFVLVLSSLLSLIQQQLKMNPLEDFSQCLSQVKASCEDLKSVLNFFQNFLLDIGKISSEVQRVLCEKNAIQRYSEAALPVMNNVLLMPSPLIRIDTNYADEKNDLLERLELTPVEGAHKSLFSRYERRNQDHGVQRSKLRANLLVSRINFDDTISMGSAEKQSLHARLLTPKKNTLNAIRPGKYSRLFSSRAIKTNKGVNSSTMSIPCSSKANSTAIANAVGEMHNISELTLDITAKSLCSVNSDFDTPEKQISKEQNFKNASEREDSTSTFRSKPNIPEIFETTEIEITNDSDKDTLKSEDVKQRRRSIGDLVERYKRLLEQSNRTPSPKISHIEHENE